VRRRGVPLAWYSDRHSIFSRNDKQPWTLAEELAGRRQPTQVARALEQLGVQLILAHSPQAKGRVERCWGTLQDRLVKELRRAEARTLEEANAVLERSLPRFRQRFAVAAADPKPAYRPLPLSLDLDGVCSLHYTRVVANDNTVRLEERLVQLPPGPGGRSYAGCRVQLQERLDGTLAVVYRGQTVALQPAAAATTTLRARRRRRGRELPVERLQVQPSPTPPVAATPTQKPPPSVHPWRRWAFRGTESQTTKRT